MVQRSTLNYTKTCSIQTVYKKIKIKKSFKLEQNDNLFLIFMDRTFQNKSKLWLTMCLFMYCGVHTEAKIQNLVQVNNFCQYLLKTNVI